MIDNKTNINDINWKYFKLAKMFPAAHIIGVEAIPYSYVCALANIG